jgi:hypothetical protein
VLRCAPRSASSDAGGGAWSSKPARPRATALGELAGGGNVAGRQGAAREEGERRGGDAAIAARRQRLGGVTHLRYRVVRDGGSANGASAAEAVAAQVTQRGRVSES